MLRLPMKDSDFVARGDQPLDQKVANEQRPADYENAHRVTSKRNGKSRREVSVVILQAEMRDQLLALHPAKRIFQFHRLDEYIVLRIEARGRHRRLEKEREP